MNNPQLIAYIRLQMQNGASPDAIKTSLRSSGWTDADIEQALRDPGVFIQPGITPVSGGGRSHGRFFVTLLVIVLVVGGGVFFLKSQNISVSEFIATLMPKTDRLPFLGNSTPSYDVSPKDSYLFMRADADMIKTYADMDAYFMKHSSQAQLASINENRAEVDSLPDEFKQEIVSAMIVNNPLGPKITDVQEIVAGNLATLHIQTNELGLTAEITLVLEDGEWKLEQETWSR